jgi:hypothetical protein
MTRQHTSAYGSTTTAFPAFSSSPLCNQSTSCNELRKPRQKERTAPVFEECKILKLYMTCSEKTIALDLGISTFELRSRIAFWLDSLELRKHLERIEISNTILEWTKIAQYKYFKAFWLDSLEQQKQLERIEATNSLLELTKIAQYTYSQDSKKINDRSGVLEKRWNRDAERRRHKRTEVRAGGL